ncbi:hypothetical protein [Streptomyces sp. HD]|uniref:hypothetical protein n=1 Tax=Streptomyces sp. HD TaxID=3020892 RepID=UPI00232B40A5|nr:hypothetical protein [Streptomyces sp. HD]MDC0772730.1 hypothetical protein [Streptomyces sp. HD]
MTARPRPGSEVRVPWEDLLCTEDSLLASVTAAGLAGLRGTLRAALTAAPTDRGADACEALLEALDRLLAETRQGVPGSGGVPEGSAPPAEVPQAGFPTAGSPQDDSPAAAVPQGGGRASGGSRFASPQAGAPQAEVSQTDSTRAGIPQAGFLPAGEIPQADPAQAGAQPADVPRPGAAQPGPPHPTGAPNGSTTPRTPPRPATPPPPPILALATELARSPEVNDFATGAMPPPSDGPDGTDRVRRWYHLTLLRLPDRHAGVWRTRAAGADPVGAEPWETLPGWADEVLLPPSGDGRGGIRTVRKKVTEASDLAEIVFALLKHDEALCLLLDRVWTGGSTRLTDPQVSQAYRSELTKRLESLERSPRDGAERLRASVSVDEALCSVTHLPPGAPGSWWNQLAAESHAAPLDLYRELHSAGRNVEAVLPARPYRQARRHTRAGDDIRLGVGGRPGDTLTCLRLWLRVGDQVFPGRVVYRGQE